jgi:hypothetical protein
MRILFFPWFGGTPRQIGKFKNMYKSVFGEKTVVDVVPYRIRDGISYSQLKKIQNGLLDHHVKSDHYDCVHMVSGGSLIADNMKSNFTAEKSIFDSGPFYPCTRLATNYICHELSIPYQPWLQKAVNKYLTGVEGLPKNAIEIFEQSLEDTYSESLVLLPKEDHLVNHEMIDLFAKNTSAHVEYFNESKHAELLRSEKEKYIECLKAHLTK